MQPVECELHQDEVSSGQKPPVEQPAAIRREETPADEETDQEEVLVTGDEEEYVSLKEAEPAVEEPACTQEVEELVKQPEITDEGLEYTTPPAYSPVLLDITIEELLSEIGDDAEAAAQKYNDQWLALSGIVALVDVNERRSVQYICVSGENQDIFKSIKCLFAPEKTNSLRNLERGGKVTVGGRFRGSVTTLSLLDCSIVTDY